MATIVGGIASSHTPTIGFALDTNKQKDAVWAPIFAGYEPVQRWLADEPVQAYPEPLEWGGCDRTAGEALVGALLVVEQRDDRRPPVEVRHRRERSLGASHHE